MSVHILSGPWSEAGVEEWLLETVIPVRLATAGSNGPLVQSLWFEYRDGALWCATQRESVLATRLRSDDRVGWEVSGDEPPYRGVRGHGRVELLEDVNLAREVLARLVARYGQAGTPLESWLTSRVDTEVIVRITDLRAASWDYSPRM